MMIKKSFENCLYPPSPP